MRFVVLATVLLASSSLCPSVAQEPGKAPITAPQTVPAQPDQNSQQQRDQRTDRDQPRGDDREMGRAAGWVAAMTTVRAAKTAKWVPTGEFIATVMIATWSADNTVTGMIEAGTARTETKTTGVTTMKNVPAIA